MFVKILIKTVKLIWIWTLRNLISIVMSIFWYCHMIIVGKKIDENTTWRLKDILERGQILLNSINTDFESVRRVYGQVYQKYISDPLKGVIDWSPTFNIVQYRSGDDCDGMGVVYAKLFKTYFKTNKNFTCHEIYRQIYDNGDVNHKYTYNVKCYSFVGARLNMYMFQRAHVMCVAKVTNKSTGRVVYLLGDYDTSVYATWREIFEHYKVRYIKEEEQKDLDIVKTWIP